MASTHAPSEALAYAKQMVKSGRLDDSNVYPQILDEVHKIIWYAAPWSWTVAQLTTQTLVAGTTDYTISVPSDFEYIYKAQLVDTGQVNKPLKISPILPADSIRTGETLAIAYNSTTFRVFPKPPATLPATAQKIICLYKKTAPEITVANYTNVGIHVLPDRWWHVYKMGVLSRAYLWGDDDRGGDCKMDGRNKGVEYGGAEAMFRAMIDDMRMKEPMHSEWETFQENSADNR